MPGSETGKQRASRIVLDHYRKPDSLVRTKRAVAALVTVLTCSWVAWGLIDTPNGNLRYSHGPLSAVHEKFEANCSKCHIPYRPIKREAWITSLPGWEPSSAGQCQSCHQGPVHHANASGDSLEDCAACHPDHRGRTADLNRVSDTMCTNCHANLANHMKGHSKFRQSLDNVGSFAERHPEFRSLKSDPGRIQFNHKIHMTAGLRATPDDRVTTTLRDLPDPHRGKYQQADQMLDDLVQLKCSSCHAKRRDLDDQANDAGGDYEPVTYETHCAICHPLSYEPGSAKTLSHGLSPMEMREFLGREYAKQSAGRPAQGTRHAPRRPIPGHRDSSRQTPVDSAGWVEAKVEKAQRHLNQVVCSHCHEYQQEDRMDWAPVAKAQIPEVWFQHAHFDHVDHREMKCRDCHAQAYPDDSRAAETAQVVMIAGRDTCLECHGPSASVSGQPNQSARYDCAGCHKYHGREAHFGIH